MVVTLCLLVQFVVEIGKEGLQTGKKGIVVSTLQFIDELADVKPLIIILHSSIERYQEIHETVTHLIVGKFQQVVAETFIISFYRQISTLVNQRNRVIGIYTIFGEHGRRCFDPVKQSTQVVFGFLQHLDEESRCAGLEPVIVEHF